ncbi:peroxin 20 [Beauveria brongniartii RCEF 3172]|uniref:Peroxin 20 n=1 Tax=Beauveria brongniartii RCEF 3172 TaxID=1081107 RepID=A0A167JZ28_9HYPO|nr:peroxin 20 [Beauveria brongniartii RCEF 3172]
MADASCSGGTPFKQLIDHQSRDVSHHQDRLINGNQTRGAFRSRPQNMAQGPQEFDAFMGTSAGLPGMHHDPAGRLAAHAAALNPAQAAASPFGPAAAPDLAYQTSAAGPEMGSNWAADFSNFAAQQQQRQHLQQPQPQQRQGPIYAGAANPMQMSFQSAFAPHPTNFSSFFAPAGGAYAQPQAAAVGEADFDQEMAKWMASNAATGNMEQVDAAMEQMARELELNEQALAESTDATTTTAAAAHDERHFSDLGVPELNNLTLENREAPIVTPPEPLQEENTAAEMLSDDARNKSAVSEAAERLLESVQHESGEKWQNSVFLALMRDFRDGKKDIVGNEVQPTDGPSGEGDLSAVAAAAETIGDDAPAAT